METQETTATCFAIDCQKKAPPRASHWRSICSVGYYALSNISVNPLPSLSSSSLLHDVARSYNPAPVVGQGSRCHVLGDNVQVASA